MNLPRGPPSGRNGTGSPEATNIKFILLWLGAAHVFKPPRHWVSSCLEQLCFSTDTKPQHSHDGSFILFSWLALSSNLNLDKLCLQTPSYHMWWPWLFSAWDLSKRFWCILGKKWAKVWALIVHIKPSSGFTCCSMLPPGGGHFGINPLNHLSPNCTDKMVNWFCMMLHWLEEEGTL